jgi:putative oxidoreductase
MPSTIRTDTGLLVLRAVLGITFLLHGLDKLGDIAGTEQGFEQLGIPAVSFMAPLVALTETIGGAMLIVGLLTPLAGFALTINMLVAGLTAHAGKGFFSQDGGYEYVLVLGAASLALAVVGAGRFSADALALRGRQRPGWLRQMRTLSHQ